jgi:ATP-dependent RNA helicase RhlE
VPKHDVTHITAHTGDTDVPVTFDALGLHPNTIAAAKHMRWFKPTAVQQKVIPFALAGKDVVAVAPTGTGKTGAYALPLHSIFETQKPMLEPTQPWAVVLVPTRELAAQAVKVLRNIFRETQELITEVTGGVGFSSQREHLSQGIAVLVATPGRCEDLAQRGDLNLQNVQHWILDEMDRMLDFGFRAAVKRLIKRSGPQRNGNLLLFSATEGSAKDMLRELGLRHAERVQIFYNHLVPPELEEGVYLVTKNRKLDMLQAMLQEWTPRRTLVFLSRRDEVDSAVKKLNALGLTTRGLHSDHSMSERSSTMDKFAAGKLAVLVATDLAGRGLDVRGVDLVAHLSVPKTAEEYIHRSGRTARAGTPGRAVIVATKDDLRELQLLEHKLGRRLPRRRLKDFNYGRINTGLPKIRVSLTGRAISPKPLNRNAFTKIKTA